MLAVGEGGKPSGQRRKVTGGGLSRRVPGSPSREQRKTIEGSGTADSSRGTREVAQSSQRQGARILLLTRRGSGPMLGVLRDPLRLVIEFALFRLWGRLAVIQRDREAVSTASLLWASPCGGKFRLSAGAGRLPWLPELWLPWAVQGQGCHTLGDLHLPTVVSQLMVLAAGSTLSRELPLLRTRRRGALLPASSGRLEAHGCVTPVLTSTFALPSHAPCLPLVLTILQDLPFARKALAGVRTQVQPMFIVT